jgi:hypothetical protein
MRGALATLARALSGASGRLRGSYGAPSRVVRRSGQAVVARGIGLFPVAAAATALLPQGPVAMGAACTGLDGGRASGCRNHRRRPRQAGDRYIISNQTPRPAAVASEMGQFQTWPFSLGGASPI